MIKRFKAWLAAQRKRNHDMLYRAGWDYAAGALLAGTPSVAELEIQSHNPFHETAFDEGIRAALDAWSRRP